MTQPNDSDLYGRLGATRYRNGDYDGAARAFQRQTELEGGSNPESLFNLEIPIFSLVDFKMQLSNMMRHSAWSKPIPEHSGIGDLHSPR